MNALLLSNVCTLTLTKYIQHVNNQGGYHFVDQTKIYSSASDGFNFLGSHKLNDKQTKVHEPLTVNQQLVSC